MVNRFSVGINTLEQQRVLGERRWRLGSQRASASRARSTATRTSARSAFTEFAGWGSAAENGTKQPRLRIKNDLSIMATGSHTFKTGVTFDLQEANGFGAAGDRRDVQVSAGGRPRCQARRRRSLAAAARWRPSCWDTSTTAGRNRSVKCASGILTTRCTRRTTGASTRPAHHELRAALRVHAGRP